MNNSQSLAPGKHGFRSNTFNRNQPVTLPCELGQEPFSHRWEKSEREGRGEVRWGEEWDGAKEGPFPCNWSRDPPGTRTLKGRTITSSHNHLVPPRVLTWQCGAGPAPLGHTPARTSSPRAAHARAGHACVSGPAPLPQALGVFGVTMELPGRPERRWFPWQPGSPKPDSGGCSESGRDGV